jgi:hypothetical protein
MRSKRGEGRRQALAAAASQDPAEEVGSAMMPPAEISTIEGLDPDALPPEGLSFNYEAGVLSYNVNGEGALIRLTPDDALLLARWLLEYAQIYDRPPAEVINLAQWRGE